MLWLLEGSAMPPTVRPLREVLAAGVKDARQRLGLRQEDAATRARDYGLITWIRGTVAQAEVGVRRFGLEEVLLLALAYETTLAELIAGDDDELVELTPDARLSVGALRSLLSGDRLAGHAAEAVDVPASKGASHRPRSDRFPDVLAEAKRFGIGDRSMLERALDGIGDAERHAARKLGTTPERINMAAMSRWGRTLAEERDYRLRERGQDVSARQRQALRGHVTRELMNELEAELRDKCS
jgi:hypothetical protein